MRARSFLWLRFVFLFVLLLSSCKTQKNYTDAYHFSKHTYRTQLNDSSKNKEVTADTAVTMWASASPIVSDHSNSAPAPPFHSTVDSAIAQRPTHIQTPRKTDSLSSSSEADRKNESKESKQANDPKKRRWAIIIGASLLLMAMVAGIAVPALNGLFVANNVALTASKVVSNFGRYSRAVGGWIGILALDLVSAVGIIKYNKKENPRLATLTGGLRLAYSGVLGAGISHLLRVSPSSPPASIYHHIDKFNSFWSWGLIIFGFHLVTLGILFKNEGGKKWVNTAIRTLLIVAGLGYIIQYVGILLVPNPVTFAALVEPIFIVPMILGEISYAIWKLLKGGKK